jgi:hypothetical protein
MLTVNIPDKIKCSCNRCLRSVEHEAEFSYESIQEDKSMGPEISHVYSMITKCPHCDYQHIIAIEVIEYPLGIFNWHNSSNVGVRVNPTLDSFFSHGYNQFENLNLKD